MIWKLSPGCTVGIVVLPDEAAELGEELLAAVCCAAGGMCGRWLVGIIGRLILQP
jgi:hypothetical protein